MLSSAAIIQLSELASDLISGKILFQTSGELYEGSSTTAPEFLANLETLPDLNICGSKITLDNIRTT